MWSEMLPLRQFTSSTMPVTAPLTLHSLLATSAPLQHSIPYRLQKPASWVVLLVV